MIQFDIPCPKCGMIGHDTVPYPKKDKPIWLVCTCCGFNLIKFFNNENHEFDHKYGDGTE